MLKNTKLLSICKSILPTCVFLKHRFKCFKRESDSFTPGTDCHTHEQFLTCGRNAGTNCIIVVVDIVAICIDRAIVVHVRSVFTIVARRTQPPSIESPKRIKLIYKLLFTTVTFSYHYSSMLQANSYSPLIAWISVRIV